MVLFGSKSSTKIGGKSHPFKKTQIFATKKVGNFSTSKAPKNNAVTKKCKTLMVGVHVLAKVNPPWKDFW